MHGFSFVTLLIILRYQSWTFN